MTPIDLDIIETFRKNFIHLRSQPIALYGCGERTKIILENCTEFNFIGLMDQQKQGMCFGKPVLSQEEVIESKCCIIIISTTFNLGIIYDRIQDWTFKNNLPVYHLNGTRMAPVKPDTRFQKLVCSQDKYKKEIQSSDIILFDLCDTLIMKYTLYPSDIFNIMQQELEKLYTDMDFSDFIGLRKKSEQDLTDNNSSFNLTDIYQRYVATADIDPQWISVLVEKEIETEIKNAVPRNDIVSLADYAKQLGKKLILTVTFHWNLQQVKALLTKCGIDGGIFEDIYLISPGKIDIFIDQIIEKYKDKKVLCLGNTDIIGDQLENHSEYKFLPVNSSLNIAQNLFDGRWMEYLDNFRCRYIMGIFISGVFNSPFTLNQNGKIEINSFEQIGYSFFGPMIKFFMDRLYSQAKDKGQKIIFQARDCWILKELADKYYTEYNVPSVYYLTSRRAAALLSIENNDDIRQVCEVFTYNCKHTFKRFCEIIFNISVDSNDMYSDMYIKDIEINDLISHITQNYSEQIISESSKQKNFSLRYIKESGIDVKEPLAIINFVGGGVTQSFFERAGFVNQCEYYYFGIRPSSVNISSLSRPINSAFGIGSYYTSANNAVIDNMLYAEVIFTSPQTQFMGFGDELSPVFAGDGYNAKYEKIKKAHEGIDKYINMTCGLSLDFNNIDSQFINMIFGYMFNENYFVISENVYRIFTYDDIVVSDNQIDMKNNIVK